MFKVNTVSLMPFKFIILIIAIELMLVNSSYANRSNQVEVEGYATIVDSRKDTAREKAINDAFRRAVEQAAGVIVESETMVKNFELLNDKVYSKSTGYIKNYTIIGEKIEGDTFRVKIQATVSMIRLEKDLDDIGLLIKKAGKPRLLMLISEQNILSDKLSYWWRSGDTTSIGVAENTMLSRFMEKGFNFVDRRVIIQALKDDLTAHSLTPDLSNDIALKLASEGEAEVVIIGQAVTKAGSAIMGTSIRSCQATISARVLNADTGEPLASFTTSAVVAHVDQVTGGSEALKKASAEMADKMIPQILEKWKKQVGGEYTVRLIIKGLTFDKIKVFKEFLKATIEDIEEIYDRSYKDGIAKFDIDVKKSTKEVAEELSNKVFEGGLLGVTSFTSNIIQIKFTGKINN